MPPYSLKLSSCLEFVQENIWGINEPIDAIISTF